MIPQSDRLLPSGMLSLWVSNNVEGPGTRDAPRGLADRRSDLPVEEEGSRIPRPRQVLDRWPRTAVLSPA